MYRFKKENWVRKVEDSYPRNWSTSADDYGYFEAPPRDRITWNTNYNDTLRSHSDIYTTTYDEEINGVQRELAERRRHPAALKHYKEVKVSKASPWTYKENDGRAERYQNFRNAKYAPEVYIRNGSLGIQLPPIKKRVSRNGRVYEEEYDRLPWLRPSKPTLKPMNRQKNSIFNFDYKPGWKPMGN